MGKTKAPTKPNISKAAHDLARENKLDVGPIAGTGSGGQITVKDVRAVLEEKAAPAADPKDVDAGTAQTQVEAAQSQAPPEPEPRKEKRSLPILRTSRDGRSWHCPHCDNAQRDLVTCVKCGAEREGDEAVL